MFVNVKYEAISKYYQIREIEKERGDRTGHACCPILFILKNEYCLNAREREGERGIIVTNIFY